MKIKNLKDKFKKIGYDIEEGKDCFIPYESYNDGEGNFNYDLYVNVQNGLNKHKGKIDGKHFSKEEWIMKYAREKIKPLKKGICHGVRKGNEHRSASKILNIPFIGTEIGDYSINNDNKDKTIIQWDFHNIKKEWINNISFIYTNALDHSYNPIKALTNWMKCLHSKGCIFIEIDDKKPSPSLKEHKKWTDKNKYDRKLPYNLADCFSTKPKVIIDIVNNYDSENFITTTHSNCVCIQKV